MANKFIDQNGLRYFFSKLKRMFEKKADKSDLKPVATSGKYSDLEGKPEIDTTVTEGSANAVSGGAVYTAINNLPTGGEGVTYISVSANDGGSLTADKTYDEIKSLIQSNKEIIALYDGMKFYYSYSANDILLFSTGYEYIHFNLACAASGWRFSRIELASSVQVEKLEPVYVTLSGNSNEGYTADKTFAELKTCYENGRKIILRYNYAIFSLLATGRNGEGKILQFYFSQTIEGLLLQITCSEKGWRLMEDELITSSVITTEVSESSSNGRIPSAKAVYDAIQNTTGSVHVTVTEDGDGNLSADKTFDELVSSVESGSRVIASYNDIEIPYVGASKTYSSSSDSETTTETFSVLYFQCELSNQSYMLTCEESGWQKVYLNFLHEQVDQEQNDSTQLDYIKNRTHWKEIIQADEVVLFPETEIDMSEDGIYTQAETMDVQIDDEINVLFNGELYTLPVYSMIIGGDAGVCLCLGNIDSDIKPEYESCPFGIIFNRRPGGTSWEDGATIAFADDTVPQKIKIYTGGSKPIYHKLDTKYLNTTSDISPETASDKDIATSYGIYRFFDKSRPDWEADYDEMGYIRNRPMSRSISTSSQLETQSQTITFTNGVCSDISSGILTPYINNYEIVEDVITAQWNGVEYTCNVRSVYVEYVNESGFTDSKYIPMFGNVSEVDSHYEDTAPFLVYICWNPETNQKISGLYIKSVNDMDKETSTATVMFNSSTTYYFYNKLDNAYLDISTGVIAGVSLPVSSGGVYNRIESTKSDIISKCNGDIKDHDTNVKAHNDIRLLIKDLTSRLNALADSDDTTLDQMSEIVAYIKNNKSLIDNITTTKSNVADIIDNLTTNVADKPLSAAQGVALKALIDAITVPTALSQLSDDSLHRLVTDSEKATWNSKLDLTATNNAIKTFFGGKTVVFSNTAPAEGTSDDVITFVKRSG